jgi:acetyl esterase/lipase
VPAPVYWLLPFGVAAAELSPLLFVAALVLVAVSFRSRARLNRFGGLFSVAALAVAMIPLKDVSATRRLFDTATATLRVSAPTPPVDDVSITRGIVFAEPSGKPLTIDLYRPVADRLFPVIIQIYGGAWRSGSPGDNADFAATLAHQGYLVAAIDYRHAPESRWPAQIDDVRAGIEWVIAHAGEYSGDGQHVALVGRSSGAQLALLAAYADPDRVAAVVSFYGPTDLAEGWRTPPSPDPLPVRPVLEAFLGGTPDEVPRRYEAASPVSYVTRQVPPTLLVYGARDHIVEARFGRMLDRQLRAAGASSIYLEVPWAEHAFDIIPGLTYRVTMPYVERFLAAHLK